MLSLKNKHSNPKKGCLSNVVAFFNLPIFFIFAVDLAQYLRKAKRHR